MATKTQTPDETAGRLRLEAVERAEEYGTSVACELGLMRRDDENVMHALVHHGRDLEHRLRRAEGDLESLRGDIAAAYYGTHGIEWTWDDVVNAWGIEKSEALSDPDDPT